MTIVRVTSGGIPVTESATGYPYYEASNGFGIPVTFGSTGIPLGRAGTGIVPAYPGFRQVSGLVQFPAKQVTNSSNFTQYQGRKSFFLFKSGVTKLRFQFSNSLVPVTGEIALPDATCKFGVFDPQTSAYYPVTINGQSSITVKSGQTFTTDEVTIPSTTGGIRTNGKKLFLIKYITFATAPTWFPSSVVVCTGQDYNEWGNSLADKTTSGSFTAAFVSQSDIFPAISIIGNVSDGTPVVGVLGNSIDSDAVSTSSVDYFQGGLLSALNDLGIPYVNIGASSMALWVWLSPGYASIRLRNIQNMVTAGVTHAILPCLSGDLASLVALPTFQSNLATVKALLLQYGIKTVITTPTPRTDATNTVERETGSWALRTSYLSYIAGAGIPYADDAAWMADVGNSQLWRTDLRTGSAMAVNAAGTGYATNALLYMPYGIRGRVSTISGSAVATATLRDIGGWVTDPVGAVGVEDTLSNAIAGGPSGTGATFDLTTAAVGFPSQEGIHPLPAAHAYRKTRWVSALPGLLV